MATLILSQGKTAEIDDSDMALVGIYKWSAHRSNNGKWYAFRGAGPAANRKIIWLHRFIMQTPTGLEVDHKNGNGLDCRRDNMRNATHAQNMQNKARTKSNGSGYKGVNQYGHNGKWRMMIQVDGQRIQKAGFDTAEDAARAYDVAAKQYHGAFAYLNFPE